MTIDFNSEHTLWVEKYRPNRVEDCILPNHLRDIFSEMVRKAEIPNMILYGTPGIGKTTIAKVLCKELGYDYLFINASENGNIDTLRTIIREFASTRSFDGSRKVVILDEADYLNPNSTQPALRAFIEEFSFSVSFIFTANMLSKIIQALHSRATLIDFTIPTDEKIPLAKQFLKRMKFILDNEKVEYDVKVISAAIWKWFPDFRRTISELSRYALLGKIDGNILTQVRDVPIEELIAAIKNDDFKLVRAWCATHYDADSVKIMRRIYDCLYDHFLPKCIPDIVVLIGEYQYRAAFITDQEIHLAAFLTQLMMIAEIKT